MMEEKNQETRGCFIENYLEKPGSNNIWEGRKMVEAFHKYNRMAGHNYSAPTIVPKNV